MPNSISDAASRFKMVGAQHDRVAVRRCVGGAFPRVAVTDQGRGVGDAFLGDETFERIEPVAVVGLAGVGVAGGLGAQNVSGNPLPQAPRNKVGFNANYTFVFSPGSLILSGSYIWRDVQYGDIFKNVVSSAPTWSQVDLRATWRSTDDRYEIVGYVRNVGNTVGYEAAASGSVRSFGTQNLYGINPPRTFGVDTTRLVWNRKVSTSALSMTKRCSFAKAALRSFRSSVACVASINSR